MATSEKAILEMICAPFRAQKCLIWRAPAYKRMRWDIFGCFDLIICNPVGDLIFIQATTKTNISHRRNKIKRIMREAGVIIPNAYIYGWNEKNGTFKVEKVLTWY